MADIDRQTLDKIHHQNIKLTRQDLVVSVHGYPVPTYGAFHGWLIINGVEGRYEELIQFFTDRGVEHVIPNYLAMLQGTSWAMKGTALFTFPDDRQWKNMANTLEFLQREVVPVIGDVIPVSGDRTEEYNRLSGGAGQSKHLQFCALDLVPVKSYSREELMSKLRAVHRQVGKQYNAGLGIYSGVRFHIDTCGFRQW
jgi:hypothetical protein